MNPLFKKMPIVFFLMTLFPYNVGAQNKKNTTTKEAGVVENGVIRAEKFGLKQGETKAKQTKALQAIVDLYANNVPHNSWDINLQNPEPTIIIPAGEYNVGEIELRSYVTIKGAGRGSTVLKGATFKAVKQYNITIEDFSIVGYATTSKESNYDLDKKNHSSAFKFTDCARLIFKNVSIRNYDVAFDHYNTYLVDLYSCFISYCNVCYLNDGKGNGYGGHAVRWFGGEMCDSQYGFVQKNGNGVFLNGATIEGCKYGIDLVFPTSFTVNACYFEANNFDVYGNIIRVSIENNYFSESGKKKGDAYIYATKSIGFAVIEGNAFGQPIGGAPHIQTGKDTKVYGNIMIGQNQIVNGGRIPVSDDLLPYIMEKGVNKFQTYLSNGEGLLMGQTYIYKNPKTNKYYLVTRDTEGNLLYLSFENEMK